MKRSQTEPPSRNPAARWATLSKGSIASFREKSNVAVCSFASGMRGPGSHKPLTGDHFFFRPLPQECSPPERHEPGVALAVWASTCNPRTPPRPRGLAARHKDGRWWQAVTPRRALQLGAQSRRKTKASGPSPRGNAPLRRPYTWPLSSKPQRPRCR